jgi:hypothetical protein
MVGIGRSCLQQPQVEKAPVPKQVQVSKQYRQAFQQQRQLKENIKPSKPFSVPECLTAAIASPYT